MAHALLLAANIRSADTAPSFICKVLVPGAQNPERTVGSHVTGRAELHQDSPFQGRDKPIPISNAPSSRRFGRGRHCGDT